MTEREQFLRTILADPADTAARKVYADWLEENGEPERAEYLRVEAGLAELELAARKLRERRLQLAGSGWSGNVVAPPTLVPFTLDRAFAGTVNDPRFRMLLRDASRQLSARLDAEPATFYLDPSAMERLLQSQEMRAYMAHAGPRFPFAGPLAGTTRGFLHGFAIVVTPLAGLVPGDRRSGFMYGWATLPDAPAGPDD